MVIDYLNALRNLVNESKDAPLPLEELIPADGSSDDGENAVVGQTELTELVI